MEFGRLTKKVLVLPLCVRATASIDKAAAVNHCQPCQRHTFGSFDPAVFSPAVYDCHASAMQASSPYNQGRVGCKQKTQQLGDLAVFR